LHIATILLTAVARNVEADSAAIDFDIFDNPGS